MGIFLHIFHRNKNEKYKIHYLNLHKYNKYLLKYDMNYLRHLLYSIIIFTNCNL